ncbi:hypothetical protein [Xanthobacter sediminis]
MPDLVPPDLTILGLKLEHLAAGAFGGLARAFLSPGAPIGRRVAGGVIGAFAAGYSAPVAAWLFAQRVGLPADVAVTAGGMVGFGVGLVGMSVCEGLLKWAALWRDGAAWPPK